MSGNEHFPKLQSKFLTAAFILSTVIIAVPTEAFSAQADTAQKPQSFFSRLIPKKAEASTDKSTDTMDTVTVIGARLPSFKIPFSDVPANVSYIPANVTQKDRSAIHDVQPKDYQSAIKDTEGSVFYDQVGNGVDTTFGLRGFAEGSSVVTLLDGVRMNDIDGGGVAYPLIDMSDVDTIQIDRGSASPIFGSGAFGGVVHLLTREPSEKPISTFGGLEVASHHGIKFYEGLSGTLADKVTPIGGKFKYYFKGGRNVNEGFRDNGEVRLTSFNIKSIYELPEERGRVHVGVKHMADAISNPATLNLKQYDENPEQKGESQSSNQSRVAVNLSVTLTHDNEDYRGCSNNRQIGRAHV